MASTSNADLVRELYRAIETGDFEAIDRLGGDAPFENVAFNQTTTLREDCETMKGAFPDTQIEVHSLVEQGNLVVAEATGRGTHRGTLETADGTIAATGRAVSIRFVDVYECEDGRITAGRFYLDRMSLFEQLGLGESPSVEAGAPARH